MYMNKTKCQKSFLEIIHALIYVTDEWSRSLKYQSSDKVT